MLLTPQRQQQGRHGRQHRSGPVHLGVTARAKRDHEGENRLAGYPVMHDNRSLVSPGGIANPATVAVTFQHRFPQAPEVGRILPAQRVADRAHAMGQDPLPPTTAMHRALDGSFHDL